jgi:asparagine synthase (glutamine-hydrolysing)
LQLGFIPDGMGFLQNTMLFPHGHFLQIHQKGWSMHPYWSFPVSAKTPESSGEWGLEKILKASVESQMISDVPLGTFLSGGVDAPLVTQAAVQIDPKLAAFTIGVVDAQTDESKEASWYARKFGVHQQIKVINPDQLAQLLTRSDLAFSEPFADYSSLPTLLLASLARASVKVALSGDGADELFWGYSRNVRIQKNYNLMAGSHFQRFFRWSKGKLLGSERRLSTRELGYHDFTAYAYSTLFITGALKWVPRIFKGKPGQPLFLKSCKAASSEKWPAETEAMLLLRKLEFDLHLQRILLKVDRASMAESLEVRVPFLSNAMINYAIQSKPEDCIVDGQGKYLLKKQLSDLSDSQQAFASKKGFTIPLSKWIKTELKEEIAQTILPLPAAFAPFFDQKEVKKMFESHIRGQEDAAWIIWSLYSLVRWHQHAFSPAA